MRASIRWRMLSLYIAGAMGVACASGSGTTETDGLTMSGNVLLHPMAQYLNPELRDELTFAGLHASMFSISDLFGAITEPRGRMPLDPASPGCIDVVKCPFVFENLDVSNSDSGWLLGVSELRDSPTSWATVIDVVATSETVDAAAAEGRDVPDLVAFAVPLSSLDAVGPTFAGRSGAELFQRGLMVATAAGRPSEKGPDGVVPPIGGVQVHVQNSSMTVVYPNETFTGPNSVQATASHGIFLLFNSEFVPGQAAIVALNLTAPDGDEHTWTGSFAGITGGNVTVAWMVADE